MTETQSADGDAANEIFIYSNNPAIAGLPDTPKPVICEFCGLERHTKGINLFGTRIIWCPAGADPCSCPEGHIAHQALIDASIDEERKQKEAEEKAEAEIKLRERIAKITSESGMGERFLQKTFETFIADTPDRKKIIAAASLYVESFDQCLPKRGAPLPGRNGFLITGPKGTGKTHIAAAVANYLLNRGTAVICMTERNLYDRIKRTYDRSNHTDESTVRQLYETVPLLIIDDLGKEKPTDWTLATLYAIIDGRYNRAMPTIVTANYAADTLITKLTPPGEDKTTADAIVDRLAEMCKSIVMTGESWRTR